MNNGRYTGTIQENGIRTAGTGSEYVHLVVDIAGENMSVQIWLTEKARGMARGQLKACGFSVDSEELRVLEDNPEYLQGRKVPVEVYEDEYKGNLQQKARITTSEVTVARIGSLQQMLRNAKGEGDATAAEEEAVAAGAEEDDIPF